MRCTLLSVQRIGGYPRLWFGDGYHFDASEFVPDEGVAAYEARWRKVHVRVEWMTSPHGRLDRSLPQTLLRQVRNQNVRSWVERRLRSR